MVFILSKAVMPFFARYQEMFGRLCFRRFYGLGFQAVRTYKGGNEFAEAGKFLERHILEFLLGKLKFHG
jgi:hypothetical protein